MKCKGGYTEHNGECIIQGCDDGYSITWPNVASCGESGSKGADKINAALTVLAAQGVTAYKLSGDWYWSSTEASKDYIWYANMYNGGRVVNPRSNANCARFSLEF